MSLAQPWRRGAIPIAVGLALVLRIVWPLSDPAARFSWSNGIYSDPATMVHAARNAALFGDWILDYNRDLFIYPLMNGLTWLFYQLFGGPGRLPTVLLSALAGTATVAVLAWGLRRSVGPRAAVVGAFLAAVCQWMVVYSRIPVSENVVTMMLAFAAVASMGRDARSQAIAGALGVGATLFGKYHAVGFLPGLVAIPLLRERSLRSLVPVLAGGTVVFLAWVVTIWLPHGAEIGAHVQRQSTGLHGDLPFAISLQDGFGEILNTLRRSWMFFRMPVVGALGGLFAFWVAGNRRALRQRVADGSAIYAFWFLGIWAYFSLLPYKAPRYYVLLGPPLVAGAAVLIEALLRSPGIRFRPPNRWDEHVPMAAWLYCLAFGTIDAVKHYVSMALDYLSLPPSRVSDGTFDLVVGIFRNVDTFRQNLAWAGVFAIVAYIVVMWNPEILGMRSGKRPEISSTGMRRLGIAAITISVVFATWQYGWWIGHRTTFLRDVKASLPAMVGEDAVLLGSLSPLLTQDMPNRCLPYFGPPGERGLLETYGVTHLVIVGKGEEKLVEDRFPGLLDQTEIVQVWPVRTLFASTLEVRRLPPSVSGIPIHDYAPTLYELGSAEASHENWRAALDRFEEYREAGGEEIPELLSLESVCWFKLEDYENAEELIREAIRLRPRDPLNYQNLGVLQLRLGDRAGALGNMMRALRLDPKNKDLEAMIRELVR